MANFYTEGSPRKTEEYCWPVHFPKGTRYFNNLKFASILNKKIGRLKKNPRRKGPQAKPRQTMKVREKPPVPAPSPNLLDWV